MSKPRPIITRAEARRGGAIYYYTGRPCPKGHLDWRFVNGCTCATCAADHARRHKAARRAAGKRAA